MTILILMAIIRVGGGGQTEPTQPVPWE